MTIPDRGSPSLDRMVEEAYHILFDDMSVPVDRELFDYAVSCLKAAIGAGHTGAMVNYGALFYNGRGDLAVDMEMAYRCFSKAAMLGVPNSMYKCGDMFLHGLYVDKDPDTAFQLYMKCCMMIREDRPLDCYPDVCRRLGTCFHRGIGTGRGLVKARKYLTEAVRVFQKRIDKGDPFTSGIMDQALRELREVSGELRKQNQPGRCTE